MARYTISFDSSKIAVWHEAIATVLAALEDNRQRAIASLYISTGIISDLIDRYGVMVGPGKVDTPWTPDVVREHLQEVVQAYLLTPASPAAISQAVAATTMVPPVIRALNIVARWLLGFQLLPNRTFTEVDGVIVGINPAPFNIDSTNDKLVFNINGVPITVTLTHGTSVDVNTIVDDINAVPSSVTAYALGNFLKLSLAPQSGLSFYVDSTSTAAATLGLPVQETHGNLTVPQGQGVVPAGWLINTPSGTISQIGSTSFTFDSAPLTIVGSKTEPFAGLTGGQILGNPSFEEGLDGWTPIGNSKFFVDIGRSVDGNSSLAVVTTSGAQIIISDPMPVLPGYEVVVSGYHQAESSVSQPSTIVDISSKILDSANTQGIQYLFAPNGITEVTVNQTTGSVNFSTLLMYRGVSSGETPFSQAFTNPVSSSQQKPDSTSMVYDPNVDFVRAGVQPGHVIQVSSVTVPFWSTNSSSIPRQFYGVIKSVSTNTLLVDIFRNTPQLDTPNIHSYTLKQYSGWLKDARRDPAGLLQTIVQIPGAPIFSLGDLAVAPFNSLTVIGTVTALINFDNDTLVQITWSAGVPDLFAYALAVTNVTIIDAPPPGSPYTIWRSMSAVDSPTVGTTIDLIDPAYLGPDWIGAGLLMQIQSVSNPPTGTVIYNGSTALFFSNGWNVTAKLSQDLPLASTIVIAIVIKTSNLEPPPNITNLNLAPISLATIRVYNGTLTTTATRHTVVIATVDTPASYFGFSKIPSTFAAIRFAVPNISGYLNAYVVAVAYDQQLTFVDADVNLGATLTPTVSLDLNTPQGLAIGFFYATGPLSTFVKPIGMNVLIYDGPAFDTIGSETSIYLATYADQLVTAAKSSDVVPDASSATFTYDLNFYDAHNTFISNLSSGPITPSPSLDYSQFTFSGIIPPSSSTAQLEITVEPAGDNGGSLATIDDLSVVVNIPPTYLKLSNSDHFQIVNFGATQLPASGVILFTGTPPADGDTITLGGITYEFDTGSFASGLVQYGGLQPSGIIQVGGTVFEFATSGVGVLSGTLPIPFGPTSNDTFANLTSGINTFVSHVHATQNVGSQAVQIVSLIPGPTGDLTTFTMSGINYTLIPNTGTLAGGDAPSVTSGNVAIFTVPSGTLYDPLLIWQALVNSINTGNPDATADIVPSAGAVQITSTAIGVQANTVVFTSYAPDNSYSIYPTTGFLTLTQTTVPTARIIFQANPVTHYAINLAGRLYEFVPSLNTPTIYSGNPVLIGPNAAATAANFAATLEPYMFVAAATGNAVNVFLTLSVPDALIRSTKPSVITALPDNGDHGPDTIVSTNSVSRSYNVLSTAIANISADSVVQIGFAASGPPTSTLTITTNTDIGAGSTIYVVIFSSQPGNVSSITDNAGNQYGQLVLTGNNIEVYSTMQIIGGLPDYAIGATLPRGSTITINATAPYNNGVIAIALASSALFAVDSTQTATGTGSTITISHPNPFTNSGDDIITCYLIQGDLGTDTFVPDVRYTPVAAVGLHYGSINFTARIISRVLAPQTFNAPIVDTGVFTAAQAAATINAQVSGITASVISGAVALTADSGSQLLAIGQGTANPVLGFTPGAAVAHTANPQPVWALSFVAPGSVTITSEADPSSTKYFGTLWSARTWIAASGVIPNNLMASGIINIDNEIIVAGDAVQVQNYFQPVDVSTEDNGRHTTITYTLSIDNVASGTTLFLASPYLLSELSKSLHLNDNTIPRNKQRKHRGYNLLVASPDDFTATTMGLLSMAGHTVQEQVPQLNGISFVHLKNTNLVQYSDVASLAGTAAAGVINFTGQPNDGDLVTIGDDVYEFDSNFQITPGNIQVPIALTISGTAQSLVDQINSNSLVATAQLNSNAVSVTVMAAQVGSDGNNIVFALAPVSGIFTNISTPTLNARLNGGVDPIPLYRDLDYEIDYVAGRMRRLPGSNISDGATNVVIDYSYASNGIDPQTSYVAYSTPLGASVEADITRNIVFYGTYEDFTNPSGTAINLTPVQRTPDKFSYLKPVVRGVYQQVLTFPGVTPSGAFATLDYAAATGIMGILVRDGVPIPTDQWQFASDTVVVLNASEYIPTSQYEIEYNVKFQYVTAPISIEDTTVDYMLLPYSYKAAEVIESTTDVETTLVIDSSLRAQLPLPAVQDKSLAKLTRTLGGVTVELPPSSYTFVDNFTIELSLNAFNPGAIYEFTYTASLLT